ncbi:MAG: phospholipase D-like domain-containing protein [Polyangiaceae bacterium]|jgi:phospholipase D3/4
MIGTAVLVESIPIGLEDLPSVSGGDTTVGLLLERVESARETIDLTAMYWTLLHDPSRPDESGFTEAQVQAMGADQGRLLYEALRSAASRGVRIRVVQGPGFDTTGNPESAALARDFPSHVQVRTVRMDPWFGDGIMHQKAWIFDQRHLYVGSANMDWRALTQVKEMGVAVGDCPELARDATKYFEVWWNFAGLEPRTDVIFDESTRIWRRVPDWSEHCPPGERKPSPFDDDAYATRYNVANPLEAELNAERARVYLSGCPREVRGRGRTFDGRALVSTILEAERSISINVMDFAPVGLYVRSADVEVEKREPPARLNAPVWWPDLFDALLHAVLTKRVWVRLLVSKWAYSSPLIEPYLQALQKAAEAGRTDSRLSGGLLEVKRFIVPGWDATTGPNRKYVDHSRVNHAKYVVTDRRANIGSSNMTADYFAGTAGMSLNTDHPGLVRDLQNAFDRDWTSRYASVLPNI